MKLRISTSKPAKLVLATIVFMAGIFICGVNYLGRDECAVSINLWHPERFQIIGPGINFSVPVFSRVKRYPLEFHLVFADYRLGNFNEIKRIENITTDGYEAFLHLLVTCQFERDSAEALINRFRGHFPQDYLEYHIRQFCIEKTATLDRSSFTPENYPAFLKHWSRECQELLRMKGFQLSGLTFTTYNNQQPVVNPMADTALDRVN